jgi:hypothetical protein
MKNSTIKINNLEYSSIAYCEAKGLGRCFTAYAEHCASEEITEDGIGFNPYSGYVYIALENGVSICSSMGQSVEYLVTNFYNGEEYFFDTYKEAVNFDHSNDENI